MQTSSATPLKIGIIGFDTSHVLAFTKLLNNADDPHHVPGAKVVAGFPSFSPDLASSADRVEGYTNEMRDDFGIEIVDSIEALLPKCDAVLLESVDGRRHLAEATTVIKAGKPLFIDKPLAANYNDAAAIVKLAQEHSVPIMSSSSLRFDLNISNLKNDAELGEVYACDAFTSASLDPTNPGLFWYGVHGAEILYTFMGTGCQSVRTTHTDEYDLVVGQWNDGRIGTLRGIRKGSVSFGASVFGANKVEQTKFSSEVPFYAQLLRQIIPFLQGEKTPIPIEETLEIMAFMQAALVSQNENRDVKLSEVTS
jgi:hypothetical protein